MMKKLIIAVAASSLITGCSTLGTTAISEPSNFIGLRTGETDKIAIAAKFGQPHDVVGFGDKRTWRYLKVKTSPEPIGFFFSVIIWPLAFIMQTEYEITQTEFSFDNNRKLVDVSTRKAEKRMGFFSAVGTLKDSKDVSEAASARVKSEMMESGLTFDDLSAQKAPVYLAI